MAKAKRVWSRKAKKADSKATAGQQMSDEELEAQARVHGVVRSSVAAHGGLGVPWSLDDIPPPDPPPPEGDPDIVLQRDVALMAAALGGFGPERMKKEAKASAKD